MLQLFIDHRKEVIRRRSRFLLIRCRNRAHILEGLILAVSDIDEIIELIKKSPDAPTAKLNLMKKAAAAGGIGDTEKTVAGRVCKAGKFGRPVPYRAAGRCHFEYAACETYRP